MQQACHTANKKLGCQQDDMWAGTHIKSTAGADAGMMVDLKDIFSCTFTLTISLHPSIFVFAH